MPMRCCRLAGALLLLCHLAPSSPAAALPSPACSRHGRTAGCVDTECCAPHGHLKRVSLSRLGTRPAFVPVWPVGRIVDQDRRLGMQFRQPWAVNCARGELPEHFGKAEPKTSFALARALSLSLSCEKQQKGSCAFFFCLGLCLRSCTMCTVRKHKRVFCGSGGEGGSRPEQPSKQTGQ